MFIDKANITVRAGKGGDGAVSFHREKYVPAGGPDGGDGGKGGNVIMIADDHLSTLMDFHYKRKYVAENGENGKGRKSSGKNGADLIIKAPRGTLIIDRNSGGIIKDLSDDEPFVLAKGGRGGWGNKHFATPTRQIPRFAKPGLPGESLDIVLELKLLADVGLVGYPNVGKSTLLSAISNARPKIANYHFTTLYPNLGVVYVDEGMSFVAADIPGIIEGASAGVGLGHDFLRHIDRCRLLLHVVDISGTEGRNPVEDFETICGELREYSEELSGREQIIVANKCDILEDETLLDSLREHAESKSMRLIAVSAATGEGIRQLIFEIAQSLAALPPVKVFEPDYVPPTPEIGSADDLKIEAFDDIWSIEGKWIERLIATVNFSDYESRMFFDRILRESGIFSRLEDMGIKDGDTVSIYDLEFEYLS